MSSLRFGCVSDINVACARVAFGAVVCYCALVSAVVVLFDGERAHLEPAERTIAGLSASALSASLLLRMAPLVTPGLRFLPPGFDRDKKTKSGLTTGVAWLSYTVNFIAAATSWIFSYFALPIVRDPFTGCRIHLVRWCEWSVLAFVMTFLIEVADERGPRPAFDLAIWQGLSTSCGFLLPLCPNFVCWGLAMMFALAVNFALILRWRRRRADFVAARAFAAGPRESVSHAGAAEVAARTGFSYYVLSSCLCIWSMFILTYVLSCFVRLSGLDPHESPSWPFCVDAVVDLIAKLVYAAVIVDAHGSLFDSAALNERRLDELRELMAVVWTASSDALAVSVQHPVGRNAIRVETSVSPMALAMLRSPRAVEGGGGAVKPSYSSSELQVMRFNYETESHETESPITTSWAHGADSGADVSTRTLLEGSAEISGFAELIRRAWRVQLEESNILLHTFTKNDESVLECEATVMRLGPNRMVVVVRDITMRVARHEAEKELAVQMKAHECDSAANRFTRHEVKNGLLSAIGIADAIHERHQHATHIASARPASGDESPPSQPAPCAAAEDSMESWVCLLQSTLTLTLNSVLSETMARDLVHDTYTPCPELVDISALLKPTDLLSNHLTFETSPATLPPALIDPQLLHYVHRNAVSNACKYGEHNGEVVTRLSLRPRLLEASESPKTSSSPSRIDSVVGDDDSHRPKFVECEFTLEVVNRPGPEHAKLLQMSEQSVQDQVFTQGSRLHPALSGVPTDDAVSSVSAGDGGWIMRKCARALGGVCDIHFTPTSTTFTMRCSARRPFETVTPKSAVRKFDVQPAAAKPEEAKKKFELPAGCWGIAIDDSTIQRKLLAKLLGYVGIADDRVSVVGDTADEIHGFTAMVARHVRAHPHDHHLVIVDENLDILHASGTRSTVSGSKAVAELRVTLAAENLEGKLLAIVRSANDSSVDVAVYRDRAHGFLAKTPLKRDSVLNTLAPIWLSRFPHALSFETREI